MKANAALLTHIGNDGSVADTEDSHAHKIDQVLRHSGRVRDHGASLLA